MNLYFKIFSINCIKEVGIKIPLDHNIVNYFDGLIKVLHSIQCISIHYPS